MRDMEVLEKVDPASEPLKGRVFNAHRVASTLH